MSRLLVKKPGRGPPAGDECCSKAADAANAKGKGWKTVRLSEYDERCLKFAHDYSLRLLAIDINIDIDAMLNQTWELFAKYFTKAEVAIRQEFVKKYWPAEQ